MTNNELIAEFMGETVYATRAVMNAVPLNELKPYWLSDQLEYHTSWDWLMPVVEKIGKLYSEAFPPNEQFIQMILDKKDLPVEKHLEVIALPLGTTIEEAYKAVVDFIKWHNNK